MDAPPVRSSILRWLGIYAALTFAGAYLLLGGAVEPEVLAGWQWWHRLILVLLGGPLLVVAYVLVHSLLEGAFYAVWYFLKENPLATIAITSVVGSLIYATAQLLAQGT